MMPLRGIETGRRSTRCEEVLLLWLRRRTEKREEERDDGVEESRGGVEGLVPWV